MQIFVRTFDDRTLTFDVQSTSTINDVKQLVEQREGTCECFETMAIVHLTSSPVALKRRSLSLSVCRSIR
jgi:hypothetical protein